MKSDSETKEPAENADGRGISIRLFGTVPDSIVDGPGLRYAVFVQGCSHACPGCHNPQSHPHEGGTLRLVDDLANEILANKILSGITLSGGEPFEQACACAALARIVREKGLNVWTYSGYTFEQLRVQAEKGEPGVAELLALTDYLVDGPFVEAQKSLDLAWRGSSNQRIVDVAKSLEGNQIVLR